MTAESFRVSRRGALVCLSGLIAAPFVIRNSAVLMQARTRLPLMENELECRVLLGACLWTAHPPIVKEAKKWREAMDWLAQNRVVIRWSREGWTHIARIGEAEGRYRATWLP